MSDAARKRGQNLLKDVVKDIKARRPTLAKIREATKLMKEIDPELDVSDVEGLLDLSEAVADDILKRAKDLEKT